MLYMSSPKETPLCRQLHWNSVAFVTSVTRLCHGQIFSSSVVCSLPLPSFYPTAPQPESASFLVFLQLLSLFAWRHKGSRPSSMQCSSSPCLPASSSSKCHRTPCPWLMCLVSLVRPSSVLFCPEKKKHKNNIGDVIALKLLHLHLLLTAQLLIHRCAPRSAVCTAQAVIWRKVVVIDH